MAHKKILFIDDDTDLVTLMQIRLAQEPFEVYTAHNGYHGLALARTIMPDIIVSDIVMPEADGYTFLRELKSIEDMSSIPVIVASAREILRDTIMLEGADRFLSKPYYYEELRTSIQELLLAG